MCSKRHRTSILAWKHMAVDIEASSVYVGYLILQKLPCSGPYITFINHEILAKAHQAHLVSTKII